MPEGQDLVYYLVPKVNLEEFYLPAEGNHTGRRAGVWNMSDFHFLRVKLREGDLTMIPLAAFEFAWNGEYWVRN